MDLLTLAQEWDRLYAMVIVNDDTIDGKQVLAMQRSFYAGALTVLSNLLTSASADQKPDVVSWVKKAALEATQFFEETTIKPQ